MQNLLIVAGQVLVLFILMGVGAVLNRTKLIDAKCVSGMVNLLLLIVTPALIVDCFQHPFDPSMLEGLAIAFLAAVFGHFLVIFLARHLVRHPNEDTERPLRLAAVFSNAGFMGIPLEQAILGDEGVFYGVTYVVVFNLFMWTWGVGTMRKGGESTSGWKILVNPGTVGIALGLPFFLLSVMLPKSLGNAVEYLANLNTPLAMVVIGYSLAEAKLGRVFRLPAAYVTVVLRLVIYPLLMVAALYPFHGVLNHTMMLAVIIASSAPVGAMVSMFSVKFGRDVDTSVAVVSGSTILSIVTMPLIIALAMEVF